MWTKLAIVKSHSGDRDVAYFSDRMEPEFGMTQFIEKGNFKPWDIFQYYKLQNYLPGLGQLCLLAINNVQNTWKLLLPIPE